MSRNSTRTKAVKRAFSDEEESSHKRSRVKEDSRAPTDAEDRNHETTTKNFAAKRLQSLRNNIKSAASRLKKPFKRAPSPKIATNDSLLTVSEACSEDGGSQTLTPINQRLSRIRSSISSSKTLTPPKQEKGGLQSRLKRNLKYDDTVIVISHSPSSVSTSPDSKAVNNNTILGAKVSPKEGSSRLADRLTKIRNAKSSSPKKAHTSKEYIDLSPLNSSKNNENLAPPEALPSLSRNDIVQDWMDSVHSRPGPKDETLSDSLTVNLDETFLNKSELLTESQGENSMEWDAVAEVEVPVPKVPAVEDRPKEVPQKEKITCLVTDTNVLMHDLAKVRDILNFLNTDDQQKLKIYVPWMVFQELDYHKDRYVQPASSLALTAQKFINKQLMQPNSKIIGQSVQDVCLQMDLGKSPDDKIFSCCLQAREKFESVILLSNDVNLCNKALTNNFKVCTAKEIISKLKSSKFLKIKVKLQAPLSQIIFHCCKEAFGEACIKMDMLQGSPWPFEGCLKRFKKYWNTVFGSLLLKQALKVVEELVSYSNRGNISDPKEFNKFKEKIKEFLFYLQDIEQFSEPIKRIQAEIDAIAESDSIL